MSVRWVYMIACCAVGAASTATAQPTPSQNEIVVEGKSRAAQIDDFVDQLAPGRFEAQLPKFLHPVCPTVVGLPDQQGRLVVDRMRKVASAVGAPVASKRCNPNVIVLVVKDKGEALAQLKEGRGDLMGGLRASDVKALAGEARPDVAVRNVDVTGSDGMPLHLIRFGNVTDTGAQAVRAVTAIGPPSRIRQLTVPEFITNIVLVEARALNGVTTRQLADFALMRTLAATGDDQQPGADSILKLFDSSGSPAAAAPSVTWWDFAFLKSLYATSNAVRANIQRHAIKGEMRRELRQVPADQL